MAGLFTLMGRHEATKPGGPWRPGPLRLRRFAGFTVPTLCKLFPAAAPAGLTKRKCHGADVRGRGLRAVGSETGQTEDVGILGAEQFGGALTLVLYEHRVSVEPWSGPRKRYDRSLNPWVLAAFTEKCNLFNGCLEER
jgi:hypothetical protein